MTKSLRIQILNEENDVLHEAVERRNVAIEVVRNAMRKATLSADGRNYIIPKRTLHRWQNTLVNSGTDADDSELDRLMIEAGWYQEGAVFGGVTQIAQPADVRFGLRHRVSPWFIRIAAFTSLLVVQTAAAGVVG